MTGLLCPIGRNLQIAWYSTAYQVKPPSGMNVTPDRATIDEIESKRGEDYQRTMQEYKKHIAGCEACRKDD